MTATAQDRRLDTRGARPLEILESLEQDAGLVVPQHREWWSNYLHSHRGHTLELRALVRRSTPAPATVADVGSFPGHLAALLAHEGYRVLVVDLEPERAGGFWDKHGIPSWRCDVETEALPFASSSVDLVVLAEVLEHLRLDPFNVLVEAHRSLRSGGRLILSVPNISPRHRIRFLLGKDYQGDLIAEFRSLQEIGHMGHYRLFSRSEIEAMLRHTGFAVEALRITGWLPGGRWSFVRYAGPVRNRFRSHLYVTARKV